MSGLQTTNENTKGGFIMSKYTNDLHSLSHTKWNCKYHVVFATKYRRKAFYDARRIEVGKNTKKIQEYIQNQLKEDQTAEQLELEMEDPFTGNKCMP